MPLRFGSFQLDEDRLELRQGETPIDVQPRVLETILFLAQRRGRVVTKEELIAGPWKGVRVSDAALSQAISQARAALGEDPQFPQFIETLRGKGFRFCAELAAAPTLNEAGPRSTRLRPFFGRERETARLDAAADEARSGHGNVVLLHGPAGVGKTRLAQWFVTQQREAGSQVYWGGCREGQSAPPFWPWPEVLHRYAEAQDIAILKRLAVGLEQDLVAVAPELREALGGSAMSDADESPQRAASVLDAMAGFLQRASDEAPLTLVLEDLHLADDAALRVLEVIARSIEGRQLMILGTFRSAEGASRTVLSLASKGSLPRTCTVALEGLSLADVRQWLTSAAASPLPEAAIGAVHFATEGLPLLVEALVEGLPDWDAGTRATRSDIREILGRRLNQLDSSTRRVLQTAAVCGEEFPIGVLAVATSEPLSALLPLLERGEQQGLLKPATRGHARFAHALHRDLLYQELDTSERRKQHAVFARAFAEQLTDRPETIVETAHHFLEALPFTDAQEVVAYAQKAADWARARHAYGRAADYYERALAVLDLAPANPHQYAELLLALGHAQCVAGAVDDAIATLERTFEVTRAHDRYDLFCQAILLWFQLRQESAVLDFVFHARITEALQHVVEKDATFAQLQVARAMALVLTAPASERVAWVQEALALTRGIANKRARLDVLRGALRCATAFTDGTTALALTEEMLDLASSLQSPENELEARHWKVFYLLEQGNGDEYARQVAQYAQRAAVFQTPLASWTANMHRVGRLFLSGDLVECERVMREAGESGANLLGIVAVLHLTAQLFQVGLELTGADAERVLGDAHANAAQILAVAPKYHGLLTMDLRGEMYRGQPRAALQYLSGMTTPAYVPPDPLDQTCQCALASIADMAAELGHTEAAAIALQLLEPHDGLHAGTATGSVYLGAASYWRGRLCLILGRRTEAAKHLERAVRASQQVGSVTFRAWSEYYLAQALELDTHAKQALLEDSRCAAHRHGMTRLLAKLHHDDWTLN